MPPTEVVFDSPTRDGRWRLYFPQPDFVTSAVLERVKGSAQPHRNYQAAQSVQAEMAKAQAMLEQLEVEGASGGGLVKVRATAKGRILGLDIDPSLLNAADKDMLEDLLVAAFNDARNKADAVGTAEMAKLTAGMPLPPGFKF